MSAEKATDSTGNAIRRRIREIAERAEKAKFPEGHVHEGTGELLSCQPCQTSNKHWIEMLENSSQDIPFLLAELAATEKRVRELERKLSENRWNIK